jgi:hypothetical protein
MEQIEQRKLNTLKTSLELIIKLERIYVNFKLKMKISSVYSDSMLVIWLMLIVIVEFDSKSKSSFSFWKYS